MASLQSLLEVGIYINGLDREREKGSDKENVLDKQEKSTFELNGQKDVIDEGRRPLCSDPVVNLTLLTL